MLYLILLKLRASRAEFVRGEMHYSWRGNTFPRVVGEATVLTSASKVVEDNGKHVVI